MFNKVGTPVLIDKVLNFDPAIADMIKCKCGAVVGARSAGMFLATGASKIVAAGAPVVCSSCGETTHV